MMTPAGNSMGAGHKAAAAALLFTSVGVIAWSKAGWETALVPLGAYYAALVMQTFLSIRTFAPLTPRSLAQHAIDAVLVIIYMLLAFSMQSVALFSALSALLFVVSTVKYLHMQTLTGAMALVSRKIRLNTLAALLSIVALGISLSGFSTIAAWLLGTTFVVGSVYLIFLDPIYRAEREA